MIGGPVCGGRHTHTQTAKVKTGKRKGEKEYVGEYKQQKCEQD